MDTPELRLDPDAMRAIVSLLDLMEIGLVVGRGGAIADANAAFCAMFGRPIDELRGIESAVLLAPQERPTVAQIRSQPEAGPGFGRHQAVGLTNEGDRFPLDFGFTARRLPSGDAEVVALLRDLRPDRSRAELLERLTVLVDWSPVGVIVWDGNGVEDPMQLRLVSANRSAAEMLQIQPDDVVGKTIAEVFPVVRPGDAHRLLAMCGTDTVEHFGNVAYGGPRRGARRYRWRGVALPGGLVAAMFEDDARGMAAELRHGELLERLLDTSDAQRRHLAMQVHDDSIQHLAAAAVLLSGLLRHPDSPQRFERLSQIESSIREAMAGLRRVVFDLSPPELVDSGLESALRSAAGYTFAGSSTRVSVDVDLRREPDDPVRLALFRIATEAMANVHKHAQARQVDLTLREEGRWLCLEVADDGRGFGSSEDRPGHIGLRGMRERAAALGGECLLSRRLDGAGTLVSVRIPIDGRLGMEGGPTRWATTSELESSEVELLRSERDRLTLAASAAWEEAALARARLRDALGVMKAMLDTSLDAAGVAKVAVEPVARAVRDGCAIRLLSEDGSRLVRAASWHPRPDQLAYLDRHLFVDRDADEGHMGVALRSGVPVVIDSVAAAWLSVDGPTPPSGPIEVRSAIIAPLRAEGSVFGTMTLVRDQTADLFTPDDTEFASCLADRVAIGMLLARQRA